MEGSFQRQDLAQYEAQAKGNLCSSLSSQNYQACQMTFAQFTHKESKQRVFCLLLLEAEVICIINPLLDINPKPFDPKLIHKFKPNQLVVSKVDGKYCAIKCSERAHFVRLQALLCDALAESICCDSMKPLQSGRLSATRLTRCLNTCKLLTRDVALVQQVSRLKSIRRQINNTLQAMNTNQCVIPSPEVRKVRAGCNFIQRIYPTFRSDPDLQFLTEQLRGGKHSTDDLEAICKLLLHVEQEDKTEFLRMVRATSSTPSKNANQNTATDTVTCTVSSKKHSTQHVLLSPAKRIAAHKKVHWDSTVHSNEKNERNVHHIRKTGRQFTSNVNSPRRTPSIQPEPTLIVDYNTISLKNTVPVVLTPTKSNTSEIVVTATPVSNSVLHARVLSPSKRIPTEKVKPKSRSVPSISALYIMAVLIMGLYYVYRCWPQYSAFTFTTPTGVTTVSISVSSATTDTSLYPYDTTTIHDATTPATILATPNLVNGTTILETLPYTEMSDITDNSVIDGKPKIGELAIGMKYGNNLKLSPIKNTLKRLSRILLSPIKFAKALWYNTVRCIERFKGAKRVRI